MNTHPRTSSILPMLCLVLAGCTADGHILSVDLYSDFVPGAEFVLVEATLEPHGGGAVRNIMHGALRGAGYVEGVRVADFEGLPTGRYILVVSLLRSDGQVVVVREVDLRLERNYAVTLSATRACEEVECGDGQTCSGGRCVEQTCTPEAPESCPTPGCATAAECPVPSASCAEAACVVGECFAVESASSTCGPDEFCAPESTCTLYPELPDAGGPLDGGPDATIDGGPVPMDPPVQVAPARNAHLGNLIAPNGDTNTGDWNRPKFYWRTAPDAVEYQLQVSTRQDFSDVVIDIRTIELFYVEPTGGTLLDDTVSAGDPDGGEHWWRVTACNAAGACAPFGSPSRFFVNRVREDLHTSTRNGIGEIVVGAPQNRTSGGFSGEVVVHHRDGASWSQSGVGTHPDSSSNGELGSSVAVGNFNGIGGNEIAAGVPLYSTMMFGQVGQVEIFQGGDRTGPTDPAIMTRRGPFFGPDNAEGSSTGRSDTWFGAALAVPGDLNGDGNDDLVVGQPGSDGVSDGPQGKIVIYWGDRSVGLQETNRTVIISPAPFDVMEESDLFGSAVAAIGDINADGYVDFAVGAWADSQSGSYRQGRVYVYYGGPDVHSADVLERTAQEIALPPSIGARDDDWFGRAIAGIGDVNRDGFGDILIGAPGDAVGRDNGTAYVFFGSGAGIDLGAVNPPISIPHPDRAAALSRFGMHVAGGGDVDGDGRPDFVISAPDDQVPAAIGGRVWLYRTSATDPWVVPPSEELFLSSPPPPGRSYGSCLALSVDRTGDGIADILVGSTHAFDSGLNPIGAVYVFVGQVGAAPAARESITATGFSPLVGNLGAFGSSCI